MTARPHDRETRPEGVVFPNAVKAAIFDMDGTLLDTERLYLAAIREACRDMGLDAPESFYERTLGRPWSYCYTLLTERFGVNFVRPRFDAAFDERFEALTRAGVPVKPGVRELLAHLSSRAAPMAVATSTDRKIAERHLESAGLIDYFPVVITAEMVSHGKPAPDIFRLAAETLGTPSGNCLALEDSPAGVHSAATSGAMTIMVPDMVPATHVEEALCVAIARSMFDVLDYLRAAEIATPLSSQVAR